MNIKDLLSGLPHIPHGIDETANVEGIYYDSRKVRENGVFVCIDGYKTDGHKFVPDAIARGASLIVCQHDVDTKGVPYIVCEDTRHALAIISKNFYKDPAKDMKLIGITGTNGKTSVTYMLKAIFERTGMKVGLIGTIQNMIGEEILPAERTTPESTELYKLLSDMRGSGVDCVVMEVSSHSLALHRVDGLEFDAAVFTNLSQDHLDFHKNMDEYLDAKLRLFSMTKTAILNRDDGRFLEMQRRITVPIYTYSIKRNDATFVAKNIRHRNSGVDFEALTDNNIARTSEREVTARRIAPRL